MESSQLHLLVNHLPITSIIIGLLVLVVGLVFNKDEVKITSLGIFIFSSLTAFLAFYTGENAENVALADGNFSETLIHVHEENSRVFFTELLILGLISVSTYLLHLKKSKITIYMYFLVLAAACATSFAGYSVSNSGRQIHHPELRNSKNVIDVETMR